MINPEVPVRRFVPTLTDVVKPGHEPAVPKTQPVVPKPSLLDQETATNAAPADFEAAGVETSRVLDSVRSDPPPLTAAQAQRVGASVASDLQAVISAIAAHHVKAQQEALIQELTQQLTPLISVLVAEALEQELCRDSPRISGRQDSSR